MKNSRPYTHNFNISSIPRINVSNLCLYHYDGVSPDGRPHTHNGWEVGFVLSGAGHYRMGECDYTLTRNDLVLVPPDVVHFETGDKASLMEMVFLTFHHQFTPANDYYLPFHGPLVVNTTAYPELESILRNILIETMEQKEGFEILINAHVARIFVVLRRIVNPTGSTKEYPHSLPELVSLRKNRMVEDIKDYLGNHLSEDINMQDLAARFFFSPQHLARVFKEVTGNTPKDYLTKLKVARAMELLQDTGLDVSEIAAHLGYRDIHHFYRVFKKETAQTPVRYRTMMNK